MNISELYYYGIAGIIISIIGFYDDMNEIPSFLKLLMQIFVFYIITFGENALVNSFHGLLVYMNYQNVESIIFSLFVYVVIINAINLVDGIDGLSASLSLFLFNYSLFLLYI